MIQKLKPFLAVLLPVTLLFFSIQYFAVEQLKEIYVFLYNTWSIYAFHFFATLLTYIFVVFVYKTFPEKAGFAFMASSLLKMMAAIVFLLPLIQDKNNGVINDVLAFFIPYFLFLLIEIIFILKTLNKQ